MSSNSTTLRIVFLTVVFVTACLVGPMIPHVYAWNLTANPPSQTTTPGGTATYSISVFYDAAELPLPPVSLLVSPPEIGITADFLPNSRIVPFNSVMTVHVDPAKPPGVYTLDVWAHPDGVPFPGPGNRAINVQVIVQPAGPAGTDWALLNPTLSPASPNVGDSVTFRVDLVAVSSSQPFPQSPAIVAKLDGTIISGETIEYPGPVGRPVTVSSVPAWPATVGTHTITWSIGPGVLDPNPANNEVSRTFAVGPPPAQFDFEVLALPTEQTVTPGSSASYTITVNLLSGSTQNVALTLSGEPGGVTKSFSTSSGNPAFSSILTLSTSPSVSPGSYSMTVTGSGGGKTHTATIRLIVSQAKDFRIDISPPTQTISQGQVTSYSLSIVGLNGFNSPVSLSLAGLPAGANYAFSIPSGTPDFSSVLTVTLPNNVQTGSFTLTVTGSGGGLNRVASAVLVITAAQTQTQTQTTTAKGGLLETLLQSNLLLIGIIIVVVLVALALLLRRRKPSYPPPPPKPCPTCGRSLMYVKQYDRWYCNSCKEYK